MNENTKELCHWAIGEKIKNHKYIAREKGKKLGSYVYFYDKDKWQAWKNKAATGVKNAVSNYVSNWKSGANAIGSSAKEYAKLWKDGAGIKTAQEKRMQQRYEKPIGPSNKNVGPTQRMTNQADQHVSDVAKKPVERKYIAKMKTKDGKTRYFYSEKAVKNWVNRQKYQINEPDFMKNVKEIEPDAAGSMPSIKQDCQATNPDYKKKTDASVNCWHCSTAYDLRKRGYDVSAKAIESEFGSTDLDQFYECKSGSSPQAVKADNDVEIKAQRLINNTYTERYGSDGLYVKYNLDDATVNKGKVSCYLGAEDNKGATTNVIPAKAIADYAIKRNGITDINKTLDTAVHNREVYGAAMAESINKVIDQYPENSWGRIGLHWDNFNGGHSIIWEKDADGKISYIDAQVNHTVNIAEYAAATEMTASLQIQRTDNLQIKKTVLDYTTDHTDGNNNTSTYVDDTSEAYRDDMKIKIKVG